MTSAAPAVLRFRYVVEGEERAVEAGGPEIAIGRGLDNRLVLPDPSVSRSHAVIRRGDDGWAVQDLGSTNGICVNGLPVSQAALAPGDLLRVGTVDVQVDAAPESGWPAEEDPEEGILNATIVRRLEDLPGFAAAGIGDTGLVPGAATGALRAGKRRALEAAYSNEVFGHLTRLAANLLTTDSLDQVLAEVMDVAFDALPVDRGFIFLRPAQQEGVAAGELVCELARHGAGVELRPEVSVPVSRTLLRAVVERGVAVVTPDAVDDRRLAGAESVMVHQVRSALAAPLWSGQSIVGAILLDSTSRAGDFSEPDVELVTALANFAAVAIERIRYADRAEHERSMRARLERYHSPSVIGEVLSRARSGRLEPKQAEVTVLFADLVGFSTYSETAAPEEVAELLDRFFNDAVDAIFDCGGTLDKFIGDCVMAFFGAPVPQADHARRGLTAARSIRGAVEAWNAERSAAGRPPVAVRIALNSGPVVVGEVGAERRVEYTVLGNTVNVAARLEQYAARPGDVVFSEATLAAAEAADEVTRAGERPVATPPIHAELVGPLQLAGLKTPVNVYRLPPD